jgi:hypothetical protein
MHRLAPAKGLNRVFGMRGMIGRNVDEIDPRIVDQILAARCAVIGTVGGTQRARASLIYVHRAPQHASEISLQVIPDSTVRKTSASHEPYVASAVRWFVDDTCALVLAAHVNLRKHLHPGPARPVKTGVARDLSDLEPDGGFEVVQRKDPGHQFSRVLAALFVRCVSPGMRP